MPLTSASLNVSLAWALAVAQTPFANRTQGPDSTFFNLNGLNVGTFNQIATESYVIPTTTTTTVDCTSFTNLTCETFSFGHVLAIMVQPTGNQVTVGPGASNQLQWFWGGTTQSIIIPAGGMFVFSAGATATGAVVSGTHKTIALTASGGNTTVEVVIIGSTS